MSDVLQALLEDNGYCREAGAGEARMRQTSLGLEELTV